MLYYLRCCVYGILSGAMSKELALLRILLHITLMNIIVRNFEQLGNYITYAYAMRRGDTFNTFAIVRPYGPLGRLVLAYHSIVQCQNMMKCDETSPLVLLGVLSCFWQ